MSIPKVLGDRVEHRGRFLTMRKKELEDGTGYEYVERNGNKQVVTILVRNVTKNTILILEQYRYPINGYALEPVAGVMDKPWKTRDEVVKEEIVEEAGYSMDQIKSISYIGRFSASAWLTSEMAHLYLWEVEGERGEQHLDRLEDIRVHEMPEEDVLDFIIFKQSQGVLVDPKIMAALYYVHARSKKVISHK